MDTSLHTPNKNAIKAMHGEMAPKKAKSVFSAGKVMGTLFWDSHGVILIAHP